MSFTNNALYVSELSWGDLIILNLLTHLGGFVQWVQKVVLSLFALCARSKKNGKLKFK